MGLELRLAGLPIIVPDSALDALQAKLESKARGEVGKMIPNQPILRQSIKSLLAVGLPFIRAWLEKNAPGYPLPEPPRHCDLIAYMSDYGVTFGLAQLTGLRAAICAQPWEVAVVEVGSGLQVAGFAALDTRNTTTDSATRDGARSSDAASTSGAPAPAA